MPTPRSGRRWCGSCGPGPCPPAPRPRPDADTYEAFTAWLETELDAAAARNPDPGRTDTFHRLNRSEYHNVVRDLLDLDVDVAALLPADDGSYGFDNIAGVLGISPTLLERYLSAAKKISRLAVGRPAPSATAETFRLVTDLTQDVRVDGLPFGTRGGTRFDFTFPEDAVYGIRVQLSRDASGTLKPFDTPHRLEVSLDGELLETFTVGEPPPPGAARSDPEYQDWLARQRAADDGWEVRAPVRAGPHTVQVTFHQKTSAYAETLRQPFLRPYTSITGGDTRYQPYVGSVTVAGPFEASGARPAERARPASRPQSWSAAPRRGDTADEAACGAARSSRPSPARAYRRPVTERADLRGAAGVLRAGTGRGAASRRASSWGCGACSRAPTSCSGWRASRPGRRRAPPYRRPDRPLELASRLSFFLWSSIPDDELLDLAEAGMLHRPEVLRGADPAACSPTPGPTHSGDDRGFLQESQDARDGRLLARRRQAERRLPAVAPVEHCRGRAQQDIRRLQEAEAGEHLPRVEQIHRNAGLSHGRLFRADSTTLWMHSGRRLEGAPPATPAPMGRTASASGRNAAPLLRLSTRALRAARPRSPRG